MLNYTNGRSRSPKKLSNVRDQEKNSVSYPSARDCREIVAPTLHKKWKKKEKKKKTKKKTAKELIRMLGSTSAATTPSHIREKEGILAEHKIFLRSPGEGQRSLTFLLVGPTVDGLGQHLRFLFPGDCMQA